MNPFSLPILIVLGLCVIWAVIAMIHGKDRFGMFSAVIILALVYAWGLWIGYYHLVPQGEVLNNLCHGEQSMGYCEGSK